jgi:hypothetical protein
LGDGDGHLRAVGGAVGVGAREADPVGGGGRRGQDEAGRALGVGGGGPGALVAGDTGAAGEQVDLLTGDAGGGLGVGEAAGKADLGAVGDGRDAGEAELGLLGAVSFWRKLELAVFQWVAK